MLSFSFAACLPFIIELRKTISKAANYRNPRNHSSRVAHELLKAYAMAAFARNQINRLGG